MRKLDSTRELARFLALHVALGVAVGVAVASLAVFLNLLGLKDLLIESRDPYLPLAVLFVNSAAMFAAAETIRALVSVTIE
ncbi:MAG: hypothetical protein KJ587_15420 [Alphaproteobacteria bacterium]|nr:hypothetical protein [Alphaproteobacteria bacterium]